MNRFHRECSQEWAERLIHEVAYLPGGTGLHMGQSHGRASPFLAKSVLSAYFSTGLGVAFAVSDIPMARALPAITSRKRFVPPTDEVPRRLGLSSLSQVSVDYKSHTKGQRHASETRRAFPPPRLKGCQQRQSRGASGRLGGRVCSEKQNLRVPRGPRRFMGPVSPAGRATKWLDGTSSCPSAGPLRNGPQQPGLVRVAVHPR